VAKLVNKTYPGIELRKTGDVLFDAGHADQNHPGTAFVEDGSHLFETIHPQTVRFIDKDERGRIWDSVLSHLVPFEGLEVCRIHRRTIAWRASFSVQDFPPFCFVAKADGLKNFACLSPERAQRDSQQSFPSQAYV
jgi:hypothetical protein